MNRLVQFVGFRGEEYNSAVQVWGKPDFIHMWHDKRMRRDISSFDIVIFAGRATFQPEKYNAPDLREY